MICRAQVTTDIYSDAERQNTQLDDAVSLELQLCFTHRFS